MLKELLFILGYEAAELSNERKRGKGNADNGTRIATWTFFEVSTLCHKF